MKQSEFSASFCTFYSVIDFLLDFPEYSLILIRKILNNKSINLNNYDEVYLIVMNF